MQMSPDIALGCGETDPETGEQEYKACLDVYANGSPVALTTAFPYGASTAYIPEFPSGPTGLALHATGSADQSWLADADALAADTPTTIILQGSSGVLSPAPTISHAVLDDAELVTPAEGMLTLRMHHAALGGLEALPIHITDHTGATITLLNWGVPSVIEVPIASFDGDADGTADSHLWFVDLEPAGLNKLPVLFHTDLDLDGASDGDIFDVFVLFQPFPLGHPYAPGIPIFLAHSLTSQVPGQFTPPS